MITTGIILLIIGVLLKIGVLSSVGMILLIVGLVLMLLGKAGRPLGGRGHYW